MNTQSFNMTKRKPLAIADTVPPQLDPLSHAHARLVMSCQSVWDDCVPKKMGSANHASIKTCDRSAACRSAVLLHAAWGHTKHPQVRETGTVTHMHRAQDEQPSPSQGGEAR